MRPKLNLPARMGKAALKGVAFSSLYVAFVWWLNNERFDAWGDWVRQAIELAIVCVLLTYVWFFLHCTLRRVSLWPFLALSYVGFLWLLFAFETLHKLLAPFATDPPDADGLTAYKWFLLLPYAVAIAPPVIVWILEYLREVSRWRQWTIEGRGGVDAFGGPYSADRLACSLNGKYEFWNTQGVTTCGHNIILGRMDFDDDPRGTLVEIKDDANIISLGMIGSGKSVTLCYPILMTHANPVICMDMKGELSQQTIFRRSDPDWLAFKGIKGHATKHLKGGVTAILDPFCENPGLQKLAVCHSILSLIDLKSPRCRELIEAIADGCVLPESNENKHFEELAKLFIKGLIVHVLTTYHPRFHTLPYIFDLMTGIDQESGTVRLNAFKDLLMDMLSNDAAGGWPQQAAAQILQEGDRAKGSIISTVFRSLEWAGDPAMRKHLSKTDFDFREIGATDGVVHSLYIVLPSGLMNAQMRWLRTLTSVLITVLRNRPKKHLKQRVHFLLDEFPKLGGRIKIIADGFGELRSYGIRLHCILQSLSQLQRDYPNQWENFMANATIQMFGIHDMVTAAYASKRLGSRVLARMRDGNIVAEASQPKLSPDEIINKFTKSSPQQLVFPTTGLPLRLIRLSYKPMRIEGHSFRDIGFLGLKGHYEF